LVHLDFEKIIPLDRRQIVGMHHDNEDDVLLGKRITIRGKISKQSLPNIGSFGQPYDAQVAQVELKRTSIRSRSYAVLTEDSRIGIYGIGPHSGGNIISYSLLINTKSTSEMTLIHYGLNFGEKSSKNIFTVTLKNGTPMLYIAHNAILIPKKEYHLNDNAWHNVAVSMPTKSCTLSDVIMYVDGEAIETIATKDPNIFFTTSGRLSIGGFGYSHDSYERTFSHLSPFVGKIDEFYMWGRPIQTDDLKWTSTTLRDMDDKN